LKESDELLQKQIKRTHNTVPNLSRLSASLGCTLLTAININEPTLIIDCYTDISFATNLVDTLNIIKGYEI